MILGKIGKALIIYIIVQIMCVIAGVIMYGLDFEKDWTSGGRFAVAFTPMLAFAYSILIIINKYYTKSNDKQK